VRLKEYRIAFQRHAAPGTTARRIALQVFAHRAVVFFFWLTGLRRRNTDRLIAVIATATGMCGRITFSVSFHLLNCTLPNVTCRAACILVLAKAPAKAGIY